MGNLAAHAIDTRCCGSEFLTTTNTTPFRGGQDARRYSFIQSSDIHNAATDLVARLTPQATAALQYQVHAGEQVVPPLCSPHTQESAPPGTEGSSVTVSVTQTCRSVAYLTNSLTDIATRTLAHLAPLANFVEVGTTQVTITGSTYHTQTATLSVSVAGVWIYHFTEVTVQQLLRHIAGESQEQAQATIERAEGVAQVSIHLHRLDFKDLLPTSPQQITVQFFYIIS